MYTYLHATLLAGFCLHGLFEYGSHLFLFSSLCVHTFAINIPNFAIWVLALFYKQPFPYILYGFKVLVYGNLRFI